MKSVFKKFNEGIFPKSKFDADRRNIRNCESSNNLVGVNFTFSWGHLSSSQFDKTLSGYKKNFWKKSWNHFYF